MNGGPSKLRILALNLWFGGGDRCSRIVSRVNELGADVLVLSEFWDCGAGKDLVAQLKTIGFHDQFFVSAGRSLGVFVAAKSALGAADINRFEIPLRQRIQEIALSGVTVIGVYFPLKQKARKRPYFNAVRNHMKALREQNSPVLLIGDFNTGLNDLDRSHPESTKFVCGAPRTSKHCPMRWTMLGEDSDPDPGSVGDTQRRLSGGSIMLSLRLPSDPP
jgi:exonuclease III